MNQQLRRPTQNRFFSTPDALQRRTNLEFLLADPSERQPFQFTVKMKFVRKPDGGDLDIVIPPRPTLPVYLPADVFYPFTLFGSGAQGAHSGGSIAVWGAALGLLAAWWLC